MGHLLTIQQNINLWDFMVLSMFSFAHSVYDCCLDFDDRRKVQVIQNSYLGLIFGMGQCNGQCRYISHKLRQ